MQTYSFTGYRYWNTKADGKGKANARNTADQILLLEQIGRKPLLPVLNETKGDLQFGDDFAKYIPSMTGVLVGVVSRSRFTRNSVEVHFDYRNRKVTGSDALTGIGLQSDKYFVRHGFEGLKKADPFITVRSILNRQLFMNTVPMPCGKMDVIPAFPWAKETVGTLRRADILQLRDNTRLSPAIENLDAVLVPVMFTNEGGKFPEGYLTWPSDEDTPVAGTFKTVHVPKWLSPYVDAYESVGKKDSERKNNKTNKNTKANIEDKNDQYEQVAELVAKAFFAELKNQGVTVSAAVPWHRLEFLDALGYVIKIEQPIFDRSSQREDLYGYLAGAMLKVQSTPGGSKASMNLTFTHVRSESVHNKFALDEHPIFNISGGPAGNIRNFLASPTRKYTRSVQIKLEGGPYDDYLTEAIKEVENKR
jgi:hypothetical protein